MRLKLRMTFNTEIFLSTAWLHHHPCQQEGGRMKSEKTATKYFEDVKSRSAALVLWSKRSRLRLRFALWFCVLFGFFFQNKRFEINLFALWNLMQLQKKVATVELKCYECVETLEMAWFWPTVAYGGSIIFSWWQPKVVRGGLDKSWLFAQFDCLFLFWHIQRHIIVFKRVSLTEAVRFVSVKSMSCNAIFQNIKSIFLSDQASQFWGLFDTQKLKKKMWISLL